MAHKTTQAYLLLVDIVGFSERSAVDQFTFVSHLMSVFEGDSRVAEISARRGDKRPYFNSTGDGFLFAVPTDGDAEVARAMCELAAELTRRAGEVRDSDGRPLQVRAGLHIGQLTKGLGDGARRKAMAIGHGLNWVARVAALAADGQVVASADFVNFIADQVEPAWVDASFLPSKQAVGGRRLGWRLQVKHGRVAEILVLKAPGLSDQPPPALARNERIGFRLQKTLEQVGDAVAKTFVTPEGPLARSLEALRPRLTLWIPEADGLMCIPPRVELPVDPSFSPAVSQRVWALPPTDGGPPRGPVARAFITREPASALELPDWNDARAQCLERWRDSENVEEVQVASFSRHARAILCLPLVGVSDEPSGVLCIDVLDPLVGAGDLVHLAMHRILLRYGPELDALLHVRSAAM